MTDLGTTQSGGSQRCQIFSGEERVPHCLESIHKPLHLWFRGKGSCGLHLTIEQLFKRIKLEDKNHPKRK